MINDIHRTTNIHRTYIPPSGKNMLNTHVDTTESLYITKRITLPTMRIIDAIYTDIADMRSQLYHTVLLRICN